MREQYKFIILSDAHVNKEEKEMLRGIVQDAELAYRTTRKNLHANLVDEMINYDYKGIVILNKRVKPNYLIGLYKYADSKNVHEKIYLIQDQKLVSMWDILFGDGKYYAKELI